jgi:outer membrane protein assembly factor BamB
VIAGGRAFAVVVGHSFRLVALSLQSGRVLWSKAITSPGSFAVDPPAYDAGRVFVGDSVETGSSTTTRMEAYSARSGRLLWRTPPLLQTNGGSGNPAWQMDAPLAAGAGTVYGSAGGVGITMYAVSEATGRQRWAHTLPAGDHASPALSRDRVFASYPCQTWALRRDTGAVAWFRDIGCDGGGGRTPVLWSGWLWTRDAGYADHAGMDGEILSSQSGHLVRTYAADPVNDPPPAFAGSRSFLVHGGSLTARSWKTGRRLWTLAGHGITTAPLVTRDVLYAGSQSGTVYAVSAARGRVIWHANAGAPEAAPDHWSNSTVPGLSASGSTLVVAASDRLVAYRGR